LFYLDLKTACSNYRGSREILMAKKMKIMVVGTLSFVSMVIIFTFLFINLLQHTCMDNDTMSSGISQGSVAFGGLVFGDMMSVLVMLVFMSGLIYFIAK
jgi:hypothetical protein